MKKRLSKRSVLMIDKDLPTNEVSPSLMHDWVRMAIATCKAHGVTVQSISTNPSKRKGFHIRVHILRPENPRLVWRLQYLLGDDSMRASMNRLRLKARFDEWNKLFEGIRPRFRTIYTRRGQQTHRFRDISKTK
jgi:hypothetical protein